MTDNKDNDKLQPKKLTLGGSKLTLGRPSIYPKKVLGNIGSSSSTVVIEVKRGKVASDNVALSNKHTQSSNNLDNNQIDRRISALQKYQEQGGKDDSAKISTLSRLAEINQIQDVIDESGLHQDAAAENNDQAQSLPSVSSEQEPALINLDKTPRPAIKPKSDDAETEEKSSEEEKVSVKPKLLVEQKKLRKADIIHMLDEPYDDSLSRTRSLASIKRARSKEKRKAEQQTKQDKVYREVILPEIITVGELASRMTERVADVIRELMKLGVMANSNQTIDADTAELLITTFGHSAKRVQESDVENILIMPEDKEEALKPRAPIVTVMGHVDHGKTSLLDALKSTDVVAGEAGGITQHIGAYSVTMSDDRMITFIDTPGHEAFTEMRTRGAKVTDIVVLVVAADDGIKIQTVEAISHAKAAGVPIIVAINKIDKPGADVEKVKNELLMHELVPEDLGGDVMVVPVSAKQKTNLDKLEETILLVAEMQDLKANPSGKAAGAVIESKVDKGKGVIATMLVQRGTLRKGDLIVAGTTYGRIKRMNNDKGRSVLEAGPSLAVEVHGLNEAPSAGDQFNVIDNEKQARDITEYRERLLKNKKVTVNKTSLEELFQKASGEGKVKELPIILKADVNGSMEAIIGSLNKIESDEVKLRFLHQAVGGINESDISLAEATGALVVGFNVRANNAAALEAERNKVDVRYYSVIYDLIDDVKAIMSGMLSPIVREEYLGSVEIREIFNITKVGKVAGSYVTKGIVKRGAGVRLLRDNIVIHEGSLKTLKRFKEDVKEVREGYECGIAFENYNDIQVGDIVEAFELAYEKKQL